MQYLLTEQEYQSMVPISEKESLIDMVAVLNREVLALNGFECIHSRKEDPSSFYCIDCPISELGLNTCMRSQRFPK